MSRTEGSSFETCSFWGNFYLKIRHFSDTIYLVVKNNTSLLYIIHKNMKIVKFFNKKRVNTMPTLEI
jgi:hypothetical protein